MVHVFRQKAESCARVCSRVDTNDASLWLRHWPNWCAFVPKRRRHVRHRCICSLQHCFGLSSRWLEDGSSAFVLHKRVALNVTFDLACCVWPERYFQWADAGDCAISRAAAGLRPNTRDFTLLPPSFKDNVDEPAVTAAIEEIFAEKRGPFTP